MICDEFQRRDAHDSYIHLHSPMSKPISMVMVCTHRRRFSIHEYARVCTVGLRGRSPHLPGWVTQSLALAMFEIALLLEGVGISMTACQNADAKHEPQDELRCTHPRATKPLLLRRYVSLTKSYYDEDYRGEHVVPTLRLPSWFLHNFLRLP
jgi:hypothetical protein